MSSSPVLPKTELYCPRPLERIFKYSSATGLAEPALMFGVASPLNKCCINRKLPEELFVEVFVLVYAGCPFGSLEWVALLDVCTFWRGIMLKTHYFWRDAILGIPESRVDDVRTALDHRYTPTPSAGLHVIQRWALLDIHRTNLWSYNGDEEEEAIEAALSCIERMSMLSLNVKNINGLRLQAAAPAMREVCLAIRDPQSATPNPPSLLFAGHAPMLRKAKLINFKSLACLNSALFCELREIVFHQEKPLGFEFDQFLDTVALLPVLEALDILAPTRVPSSPKTVPIPLPRLRRLIFDGNCTTFVHFLASVALAGCCIHHTYTSNGQDDHTVSDLVSTILLYCPNHLITSVDIADDPQCVWIRFTPARSDWTNDASLGLISFCIDINDREPHMWDQFSSSLFLALPVKHITEVALGSLESLEWLTGIFLTALEDERETLQDPKSLTEVRISYMLDYDVGRAAVKDVVSAASDYAFFDGPHRMIDFVREIHNESDENQEESEGEAGGEDIQPQEDHAASVERDSDESRRERSDDAHVETPQEYLGFSVEEISEESDDEGYFVRLDEPQEGQIASVDENFNESGDEELSGSDAEGQGGSFYGGRDESDGESSVDEEDSDEEDPWKHHESDEELDEIDTYGEIYGNSDSDHESDDEPEFHGDDSCSYPGSSGSEVDSYSEWESNDE